MSTSSLHIAALHPYMVPPECRFGDQRSNERLKLIAMKCINGEVKRRVSRIVLRSPTSRRRTYVTAVLADVATLCSGYDLRLRRRDATAI